MRLLRPVTNTISAQPVNGTKTSPIFGSMSARVVTTAFLSDSFDLLPNEQRFGRYSHPAIGVDFLYATCRRLYPTTLSGIGPWPIYPSRLGTACNKRPFKHHLEVPLTDRTVNWRELHTQKGPRACIETHEIRLFASQRRKRGRRCERSQVEPPIGEALSLRSNAWLVKFCHCRHRNGRWRLEDIRDNISRRCPRSCSDSEVRMNEYRIYILDQTGRINLAYNFIGPDYHSALDESKRNCNNSAIEIWQEARLVARMGKKGQSANG